MRLQPDTRVQSSLVQHLKLLYNGTRHWLHTLCLGLVLSSISLCAHADTLIYLNVGSGPPVNVTASYVLQDHYLYDTAFNLVGTVDIYGVIHDTNNQEIGYIMVEPPE